MIQVALPACRIGAVGAMATHACPVEDLLDVCERSLLAVSGMLHHGVSSARTTAAVSTSATGARHAEDVRLERGKPFAACLRFDHLRSVPDGQLGALNERFRTVGGELDGSAAGFAVADRIGAFELRVCR